MKYTVEKKTSTVDVSIIVHADVYAKLVGDTSNAAAAALSNDELAAWQELFVAGTDKGITFAAA